MKELIRDEEINQLQGVVIANMGDIDSLCNAFRGCHAIFHTSSFIDPHGVSGYSVSLIYAAFPEWYFIISRSDQQIQTSKCYNNSPWHTIL